MQTLRIVMIVIMGISQIRQILVPDAICRTIMQQRIQITVLLSSLLIVQHVMMKLPGRHHHLIMMPYTSRYTAENIMANGTHALTVILMLPTMQFSVASIVMNTAIKIV